MPLSLAFISSAFIYFANIVRGVGLGFLVTPIATSAINVVPYNRITMASTMLNLLQQVGGATGVAMIASFYQWRLHTFLGDRDVSVELARAFQLKAVQESFCISGALVLLTLIPAIWLPKKLEAKKDTTADSEVVMEV